MDWVVGEDGELKKVTENDLENWLPPSTGDDDDDDDDNKNVGQDVELKMLESDADKNQYRVNYYGDKDDIDYDEVLAAIKEDGKFTSAEWTSVRHDEIKVVTSDGKEKTIYVTDYQPKTAIHYKGVIIDWADKGASAAQNIGVGKFSKGDKVICSEDKDVIAVGGSATPATQVSGTKYGLSVTVPNADDYYIVALRDDG